MDETEKGSAIPNLENRHDDTTSVDHQPHISESEEPGGNVTANPDLEAAEKPKPATAEAVVEAGKTPDGAAPEKEYLQGWRLWLLTIG